jgi:hypothetical protein
MIIRDRNSNRSWDRQSRSNPFHPAVEHLVPLPCRPEWSDAPMRPGLPDTSAFPADGVTGELRRTMVPVILTPEDCATIPELERLASELELSLDEFISRAVIAYADEVEHDLANPSHFSRRWFPA